MKILMFGWEFPPHIAGGLGVACFGLTRGLQELDAVDLTFVVPHTFGDEDERFVQVVGVDQGVPLCSETMSEDYIEVKSFLQPYLTAKSFCVAVENITTPLIRNLFEEVLEYARRAITVLDSGRGYDLVHAHDWMTFPAAMVVADRVKVPLVVHIHSTEFDRSGGNVDLRIVEIERRAMDRADCIVAVSALTRQVLIDQYNQKPEKITVIHNAIIPYSAGLNSSLPTSTKTLPVVTFVGRVTYQKGPEYFVEAAQLILQKRSDVRFILAGDGDMLPLVRELALSLGIGHAIDFPGFLCPEDVRQLFLSSTVFVMPSVSEPFGIAALEAIACNVPVVVSNRAGVSEVIDSMLKVDPEDTDHIASSVLRLIEDTNYANVLRKKATQQLQGISWRHAAEKLVEVYCELMKSKIESTPMEIHDKTAYIG